MVGGKKPGGLETVSRGRCFDDLLMKTVDDVLKQVFGEEPANVILQHAKKSYSLKGEKTPKRVEVFADDLLKILGSGAVLIENLTLKSLYSKLELKFKEKKGYGFPDYIKELRKRCSC